MHRLYRGINTSRVDVCGGKGTAWLSEDSLGVGFTNIVNVRIIILSRSRSEFIQYHISSCWTAKFNRVILSYSTQAWVILSWPWVFAKEWRLWLPDWLSYFVSWGALDDISKMRVIGAWSWRNCSRSQLLFDARRQNCWWTFVILHNQNSTLTALLYVPGPGKSLAVCLNRFELDFLNEESCTMWHPVCCWWRRTWFRIARGQGSHERLIWVTWQGPWCCMRARCAYRPLRYLYFYCPYN